MKWKLFFLFILSSSFVLAADIELSLEETGKITNYFNTYWVVQVNGTGTITNPTDNEFYDVRLYFDLLGLQILKVSGDVLIEQNSLYFNTLAASSSISFEYTILGIVAQNPTLEGKGVLYTGLSKRTPRIYTDVFGSLQKASLEDKAITGRPGRLVSVTIKNPASLPLTVESMRVIKTSTLDPNNELASWVIVNKSNPRVIEENGFFVYDILDPDSAEGQIYWLSSDVFISGVLLVDNNSIRRLTEKNLTFPVEVFNFTNLTDNTTRLLVSNKYFLLKEIEDPVVVDGVPVGVSLTLHNLGPTLQSYTLKDSLPAGFVANESLVWSGVVPARGLVTHKYSAVLNVSGTAGLDLFPSATAIIDGQTIYSPPVPFLRKFDPNERIYVQKRIEQVSDGLAKVTISVQNLGESPVENVMLRDFLDEDDVFTEISELPLSKGLWRIVSIDVGESWVVTYSTGSSDNVISLPMLYGVDPDRVLRTIILDNVVDEGWRFSTFNIIELVGVLLLILVPVFLFFRHKT